jgi:hypothetical protein
MKLVLLTILALSISTNSLDAKDVNIYQDDIGNVTVTSKIMDSDLGVDFDGSNSVGVTVEQKFTQPIEGISKTITDYSISCNYRKMSIAMQKRYDPKGDMVRVLMPNAGLFSPQSPAAQAIVDYACR